MFPKTLVENKSFWFNEPRFLGLTEKSWPNLHIGDNFADFQKVNFADLHLKTTCALGTSVEANMSKIMNVMDVNRYSLVDKLLKVTGYVIKFKNKLVDILKNKEICQLRSKRRTPGMKTVVLSCDELIEGRLMWIYAAQQTLVNDVKNFEILKKQLGLFEDERGLWRCGGRMTNADMSLDMKHPFTLPKDNYFAKLVVINSHEKVKHNGVMETLSNSRTEFWITRSWNFIIRIIHECFLCKYMEGKNYDYPEAPPLPEFRVIVELIMPGPYLSRTFISNRIGWL